MQVLTQKLSPTKLKLSITASQEQLTAIKIQVLKKLSKQSVKLPGFRNGKAPLELIERNVGQTLLQSEFLDAAVNDIYMVAVDQEKLRPIRQSNISVTKFVPFTTLEFNIEVDVVEITKVADYKHIRLKPKTVTLETKDVDLVLQSLKQRAGVKEVVTAAVEIDNQVICDISAINSKTSKPITSLVSKDYQLIIGKNNYIIGFDDHLIGAKTGDHLEFKLTIPNNYNIVKLRNTTVKFKVTINSVHSITEPKIDDDFAASIGPFKTVSDLRADVKRSLLIERQTEADRNYENELLQKIADKSEIAVPETLIEQELNQLDQQERQNIMYHGQTWQEHLDQEEITEEDHRAKKRPTAEKRVKAGIILGEIAQAEGINVTNEEVNLRIKLLKGQFQDSTMQAELDKPENIREIASRILTEKTFTKLKSYTSKS